MTARVEHVHHVIGADESRHRQQPAAQRLADDQPVGSCVLVFKREHAAGAAEARLDFVEDQQNAGLSADLAQRGKISVGRQHDARFALNRFDQHGDRVGIDRAFDRVGVAERNRDEPVCERAEATTVRFFAGEADDGGGAAVEIAGGDDDLLRAVFDAATIMAPTSCGFDRGLNRFGAGVHRQRTIEPCQAA